MATIEIRCPIVGCGYSTGNVSEAVAVVLLSTHAIAHSQPRPTSSTNVHSGPKLDRPKVGLGLSMEQWNLFTRKWDLFKSGSNIPDHLAATHLFQCADEDLADSLLKSDSNISSQSLDDVLKKMKALAVIPTAIGVLRSELLDMKQKRDEPFRGFASRVRGKAETCEFYAEIQCNCGTTNELDYTDHMMRDVLVAGIYDPDIRREVLGVEGITGKSINDVVSLLESKEMARDANTAKSSTFAISSKRDNNTLRAPKVSPPPGFKEPSSSQKSQRSSCAQCGESFPPLLKGKGGGI